MGGVITSGHSHAAVSLQAGGSLSVLITRVNSSAVKISRGRRKRKVWLGVLRLFTQGSCSSRAWDCFRGWLWTADL